MKHLLVIFLLLLPNCASATVPEKIVFAVDPVYIKQFHENGLPNNPVIKIANLLQVELEFYPCPWARCLQSIASGRADIIDDLFLTEDRKQFLVYLYPSFEVQTAGFRFYAVGQSINQYQDLHAKAVGHLRGYKLFPKFEQDPQIRKVSLLRLEDMVKMMLAGRIDVFIAPPSFAERDIAPFDTQGKIKRQKYDYMKKMPLYLGLSKKSPWLNHKKTLENILKHHYPTE